MPSDQFGTYTTRTLMGGKPLNAWLDFSDENQYGPDPSGQPGRSAPQMAVSEIGRKNMTCCHCDCLVGEVGGLGHHIVHGAGLELGHFSVVQNFQSRPLQLSSKLSLIRPANRYTSELVYPDVVSSMFIDSIVVAGLILE